MLTWLRDLALVLASLVLLSLTIWLGTHGMISAIVASPLGIGATAIPAAIIYRMNFEGKD